MNEVVEIIYQWHQGNPIKGIKRSLGFDRKTIRRYIHMAQQVGVRREETFPDEQELLKGLRALSHSVSLYAAPAIKSINTYRDQISHWLGQKDMTAKQIWRLLKENQELIVGYSSVKRYLKREFNLGAPRVTVRLEVPPAQEAQVDFGYAGLMNDPETGKARRAWVFIMTLSYLPARLSDGQVPWQTGSRHRFVRFVFRQDSPTWMECHQRAFEFFGGVPATIILDNLKSGVIKPDIYYPTIHLAYADLSAVLPAQAGMERHYGFVADPAKARTPEHKGKVERVIPVVRKHLLAGRQFRDITVANQRALSWCRDEIGQEIHGTTKRKPYQVFLEEEKPLLKPLPHELFEISLWKECSVHQDHHACLLADRWSLIALTIPFLPAISVKRLG